MNTYFVKVGRDGESSVYSYKVLASTPLDARIIAFAMDGGFEPNQANLEKGDIELVKEWTTVTVETRVLNRGDKLEQRVKELEERVGALELMNQPTQIIDTSSTIIPPQESKPDYKCRPCKPNPISFRRGD
jgi:hypothetical protein